MASALSRGTKTVVMNLQEWKNHPDKMIVQGKPFLYAEQACNVKQVILSDIK